MDMIWERRPDGRYYVCIGAAGGYGWTVAEATEAALRRASAAEKLFTALVRL